MKRIVDLRHLFSDAFCVLLPLCLGSNVLASAALGQSTRGAVTAPSRSARRSYYSGQDRASLARRAAAGALDAEVRLGILELLCLEGSCELADATRRLEAADRRGSLDAKAWLGYRFITRGGDRQRGVRYAQSAAGSGHVVGLLALAIAFRDGKGVHSDAAMSDLYYRRALSGMQRLAAEGDPFFEHGLGLMYLHGRGGLPVDTTKASALIHAAADQGYLPSRTVLGTWYRDGTNGLRRDKQMAVRLFRECAALGHPNAQFYLALMFQDDHRYREAEELYDRAAREGDDPSKVNLGLMYETGMGGIPKDPARAVALYREASADGVAVAQDNLGRLYEGGRCGLPQDDAMAAKYYEAAANQGDMHGQVDLGLIYMKGRGVRKDEAAAAKLFRAAADQGEPEAQFQLGVMYRFGLGSLPKDDAMAARLYRSSADQGNAAGQFGLGHMYEIGLGGLPQDKRRALVLYRKSAAQNDPEGVFALARMYETGEGGLRRDERMAMDLARKAASLGSTEARRVVTAGSFR